MSTPRSETEPEYDPAALLRERNRIARDLADALDNLGAVKADLADKQEQWARDYAEIQRASGKTLLDVEDEMYEDAREAVQRLKDRCWSEGYLEGINAAARKVYDLHIAESRKIAEGRDS